MSAPDENGRRQVAVYAQAEPAVPDQPWTRHAAGVLAAPGPLPGDTAPTGTGLTAWPPPGSAAVDLSGFYPALAETGLAYGPCFQGVRAAWRRDGEVFAEVALPAGRRPPGSACIRPCWTPRCRSAP